MAVKTHKLSGNILVNKQSETSERRAQMKLKTLLLVLTAAALGIVLVACSSGDQMESESEMSAAKSQQQSEPAQTADAYPIDYCIVSGEKLGSMGDPVAYNYKGRTIKFCCNHCVETFEKSPEMYIAKLDSAAAGHMMEHEGGMEMEGHEGHSHGG
jgi:YHS domain-containing protein